MWDVKGLASVMSRWIAVALIFFCMLGCGDSSEGSQDESAETTPDEPTEEAAIAVEEAVAAEVSGTAEAEHDLAGLTATVGDDGTITLIGVDRWGTRIETTFADLAFFTGAVPVLKRRFSPEQGEALDAFLQELTAAAAPEGAPETAPEEVGEAAE
jgi:hypothetical protein